MIGRGGGIPYAGERQGKVTAAKVAAIR